MCLPFSNSSYRHDFDKLIALADRLDVSIDYLLCRSEEPGGGGGAAPTDGCWRSFPKNKPPKGQRAFVQQASSGPGYFTEARLAQWDGAAWHWVSSDPGISEIEATRVLWWIPEPAYPAETEDEDAEA